MVKKIELEGENLLARALCHEIDHLNGILYLDRVEPGTLRRVDQEQKIGDELD